MLTFGPIPSRRLGRSLGINHIPPKICTYSCAYCQQGYSSKVQIERQTFYDPQAILAAVQEQVEQARAAGEPIDYLSFVPDGEPTLDINLGQEIDLLKPLHIPIAIITNASIIWQAEVREALYKADWVSVKIDSVEEAAWRRIDHPHRGLSLPRILEGILEFASHFQGQLCTETMLVEGINDKEEILNANASFIAQVNPHIAYILIPTRPPADKRVKAPSEAMVNTAYQIYGRQLKQVEYLIGADSSNFAYTGNLEKDLLSTSSVHPMRRDAVQELLAKAGQNWTVIEKLIREGQLIELDYEDNKFYMRKLFDQYKR
ncbi:MAG: radical SAM protein [Syntrophomonadaceae bacterium]|jgi:wyosine [tRNA(Phe)-imidazoG37] synthetase (radical SAM superfamily)|nr:radical SAM protein [Syntrophomonadaceae bacterium]